MRSPKYLPINYVSCKVQNSELVPNNTKSINVVTNIPHFKPKNFSGFISKNITTFLKQFHKATQKVGRINKK